MNSVAEEIWRNLVLYPGYEISTMGQVRKLNGEVLNQYKAGKNLRYLSVSIHYSGKYVMRNVHRLVALTFVPNPSLYKEVDHIDGNGLNNSVSNLRWCTHEQNNWNVKARSKPVHRSLYKGVSFHKNYKKWVAQIRIGNGKNKWLGSFDNPDKAALAYNEAAKRYHGEFAYQNNIGVV